MKSECYRSRYSTGSTIPYSRMNRGGCRRNRFLSRSSAVVSRYAWNLSIPPVHHEVVNGARVSMFRSCIQNHAQMPNVHPKFRVWNTLWGCASSNRLRTMDVSSLLCAATEGRLQDVRNVLQEAARNMNVTDEFGQSTALIASGGQTRPY
jgi:hypothetical protein